MLAQAMKRAALPGVAQEYHLCACCRLIPEIGASLPRARRSTRILRALSKTPVARVRSRSKRIVAVVLNTQRFTASSPSYLYVFAHSILTRSASGILSISDWYMAARINAPNKMKLTRMRRMAPRCMAAVRSASEF